MVREQSSNSLLAGRCLSRREAGSLFSRSVALSSRMQGCCHSSAVVSMRVQDRVTGDLIDETIPSYLRSVYRLMYQNPLGRRLIKFPVTTSLLRSATARHGVKMDSPESAAQIATFIATYGVNIEEVERPLSDYKTFNDFFARKLKPGVRPLDAPGDNSVLCSPADCRLLVYPSVEDTTRLWLKGQDFTMAGLLGPGFSHLLHEFHAPAVAIARLAPQDFHRWWMPVDATVGPRQAIDGTYFSVSPRAVREVNILCTNKREVCMFDSPLYGRWCLIAVGAAMVSSIRISDSMIEGSSVAKGAEHGEFRFGGSTLIMLFDSRAIAWDEDLIQASRRPIETYVKVGTRIGRARKIVLQEQAAAAAAGAASSSSAAAAAAGSSLLSSPSPTSPRVIHTGLTDSARKEAALNDAGLLNDFPLALSSNLTLMDRENEDTTPSAVPKYTRAKGEAASAVNAEQRQASSLTLESLLPSFLSSASTGAQDTSDESPRSPSETDPLAVPSLSRAHSDPSNTLPAPAVFHLVNYTDEDDAEADAEDEEAAAGEMDDEPRADEDNDDDEDEEMGGGGRGESARMVTPATAAARNASSAGKAKLFAHAASLMPPTASSAASSSSSASSAAVAAPSAAPSARSVSQSQSRRRSRGSRTTTTDEDATPSPPGSADAVAAASSAADELPTAKKKRTSRKK